jgi:transposase InsO family protein
MASPQSGRSKIAPVARSNPPSARLQGPGAEAAVGQRFYLRGDVVRGRLRRVRNRRLLARIVGSKAGTTMKTSLVLDRLEMSLWARGPSVGEGPVLHTVRGPVETGQFTSFAFTQRLIDAGADPSIGSVGDAYDKSPGREHDRAPQDPADKRGPWKTIDQVELATLEWVD